MKLHVQVENTEQPLLIGITNAEQPHRENGTAFCVRCVRNNTVG